MAKMVTINRPDVVALIEEAANKLNNGNKTEAVALAIRPLLEENARAGSFFGGHRDRCECEKAWTSERRLSMSRPDAETAREIER